MVSSVKSHLRQSLPHEKQRTYTFCAAASLDENTPECLSLFTLWDMRHLLACWRSKTLASTSRWICSCDFVLPQCLNETSLSCWAFSCLVWFLDFIKQMTTASNKWTAGPVLGSGLQEGGGSASSGVYQAERWHTVQTEESGCYQKPCRALLCCCCYWAT